MKTTVWQIRPQPDSASLTCRLRKRQIGYVEQETPGALIIVTITEAHTSEAIVSVMNVRAGMRENRFAISSTEFERLWHLLSSEELLTYEFVPKKSDSMSDPKFYTISLIRNGSDRKFRVPVGELSGNASESVKFIKAHISEKS